MARVFIVDHGDEDDLIECRVIAPSGKELTLAGEIFRAPQVVVGDPGLSSNQSLINNAWAYALARHSSITTEDETQRKYAELRYRAHREAVEWIADVAHDLSDIARTAWCSSCFGLHEHFKSNRPRGQLAVYMCTGCGSPTFPCAGPGCPNMAVRERGATKVLKYCAEHNHTIPGFAKADQQLESLEEYEEFLKYDKANLARTSKTLALGIAGIALLTPAGIAAAPAIGGAIGSIVGGYSGVAATSYGLALLGGGSLAGGGLGIAGGTAVVAAVGGAIGGTLGASVINAYVRADDSFRIEKLCEGDGVPVVVCNGFLSEGEDGWGGWQDMVTDRYPDSPVYRVHWGSKELKDFSGIVVGGSAKVAAGVALRNAAMRAATMGAKRVAPIAPALLAVDIAKNPWHVAKNRAEKTGIIIADLLARTNAKSYVLIGHSLGARAMVIALQNLETTKNSPRIEAAHLLGAAIGSKSDWQTLNDSVEDAVYNYHSSNDGVLKTIYKLMSVGQPAAGVVGFSPSYERIKNIDVSDAVLRHSGYFSDFRLH